MPPCRRRWRPHSRRCESADSTCVAGAIPSRWSCRARRSRPAMPSSTRHSAPAAGGLAAWLDLEGTFDPAVAERLGVGLEWLLVARPRDPVEAIELAAWLGRSGLIDALVLDLGERGVPERRALDRLASLLARPGSTPGLVLAPARRSVAGG